MYQPEPFFLSFSLYNAKECKKISEDFHIDPNSSDIRAMIPVEILRSNSVSVNGSTNAKQSVENGVSLPDVLWLELQKQVFFQNLLCSFFCIFPCIIRIA
jgi:hypothetical protein